MYKKLLAELIGTFGLAVAVVLAVSFGAPISWDQLPVLAALVVGIFVYTLGPISGAHINPAVTIGLWSVKKISARDAAGYLLAQFAGAGLAMLVASQLGGVMVASPMMSFDLMMFVAEAAGAAILTFGIASVVWNKASYGVSGMVIGGSLLVGITMAALIVPDAGVLNPAVALAVGSLDLTHILGPIAGSLVGFWSYRLIA